ncbi:helix-turn-helix domain-containing protein [Inquilinus sp. Marseille-Q2685]|uniref:helix-turn-helix domain-containing protein n=1 Tax=Inquilinus sp. Marseille-Q2685 TaxID=2866581 RepID=UPI001CE42672|nr:AraC family transcriptional regulator [Inquilinus sp. Marseille-Q2685]
MEKDETSLAALPADASCDPAGAAAALIEDVRRGLVRDPAAARAAAVRLVTLLTLSGVAEGTRGGLAPWQKRRVDRYLRRSLHRPLRIEELAEQAALSISHFARAFKDSFGTTPHGYIIRLRLEQAQRLMLTTRDPLSQIALACGLASQSHLSKLFRRWLGETPSAWRRRNQTGAVTPPLPSPRSPS